MTMMQKYDRVTVTSDTQDNYGILFDAIRGANTLHPTDIFDLFANIYGLQLFDEENTVALLEELGYYAVDEESEADFR